MNMLQKLIPQEGFLDYFAKSTGFKNAKQNIIAIQLVLFTMNPQFSLEVLNFSFLISRILYRAHIHFSA